MKLLIAFAAIVAVTSAASIDIQGAKAILQGPSATMAVDTGSIRKTEWNKDIVETPVFNFGVDVPRVLNVGVEPKTFKIDSPILLKSGIENPILLKSGVETPFLLKSGVETPILLNSRVDSSVFLKSGVESPVFLKSGIEKDVLKTDVDLTTLLKMGIDIPTLLKMGVDVPTLVKMGVIESPTVRVVPKWDWDTQLTRSVMPSFFNVDSKLIVI